MAKLLKVGKPDFEGMLMSWQDSLSFFEKVQFIDFFEKEPKGFERVEALFFFPKKSLKGVRALSSRVLIRLITKTVKISWLKQFSNILINILRNIAVPKNFEARISDFDMIHVSYNDFERSNLLTAILLKSFKRAGKNYTLSYKESRPGYNHLEYIVFSNARKISLFCEENLIFFKRKYPDVDFDSKQIIYGLDEDWKSTRHVACSSLKVNKLSSFDGKLHMCILAGRVLSNPLDERSGPRLYYVDIINQAIGNDIVVHLHTPKIIPDKKGFNPYEKLEKENKEKFIIEPPLDEKAPLDFYKTLGTYDLGFLHMTVEGSSTSEFDKYNVPNRFYHYQIAKVVPLQKAGTKPVLEKYFSGSTFFYEDMNQVNLQKTKDLIKGEVFSFGDYISSLYKLERQLDV